MSHILHLGHQPADIPAIANRISTEAIGFDPSLDSNALRFSAARADAMPFSILHPAPQGDLWLGFRYVPPSSDAHVISESNASFLEFYDAAARRLAQIRPLSSTSRYHAVAQGDTSLQGVSSYFATNAQPQWVDVRLAVGAEITIDFFVDGVLHSTATAANAGGRGKPVQLVVPNLGLHGSYTSRSWYYAHIALLDGVPTIGRRFVRRAPAALASYAEMTGEIAALADNDPGTRVLSTAPGQRLSFSLSGPSGPAGATTITGVHLRQIAQAGAEGPQATAGFLRLDGVNHDAPAEVLPRLAPKAVWSSWARNPADNSPWSLATLPGEVGILSA